MSARWKITAALLLGIPAVASAGDPGNAIAFVEPVQPEFRTPDESRQWRSISKDSAMFLSFQHSYRIVFQEKTRRFLGGPVFRDYFDSVKGLSGWEDGDNAWTNYALHPIQGASAGFIFLANDPTGSTAEFGRSKEYWHSRLKAFGFAAAYSTQFELGPLGEAAIGNVGKTRGTMGFVDLVVTPVGGFGWMLAEDALDRFLIRKLERKTRRAGWIRFVRVALNPARSFANVMRFRLPWYRRGRELNRTLVPELVPAPLLALDLFPPDLSVSDLDDPISGLSELETQAELDLP
jgi:hypothetical protein